MIDVALIGAECGLMPRSTAESVHQLHTRQISGIITAVFDDATDTWLLRTGSGDKYRARIVIDTRTLHQPSLPNYPGCTDFDGCAFHSAEWTTDFDPAGKRVAVIGNRAAHVVAALGGSEVTLFECPPNWDVPKAKRRWLPRVRRTRRPGLVTSPIERITRLGVRTVDGTEHRADAIVYSTGCSTRNGVAHEALVGSRRLTIQRAWHDGAAAYLGVAVHGFPNYFMTMGPDSPVRAKNDGQVRYIVECLQRMRHTGSTRIEVRRSAQRQFIERARVIPPSKAFELGTADVQHEIYDGPATLTVTGHDHTVHVRLTGHLDPIDGKYHWQGMVFDATSEFRTGSRPVQLAVDSYTAQARITEQTPWGSYAIAGIGAPPFELSYPT